MARRCTTVPGLARCCQAAQQGLLNRPFRFTDARGNQRCAECSTDTSHSRNPAKAGRPIFRFRFHKNQECGIGPGGCPYLGQQQGGQAGMILGPGQPLVGPGF